MRPPSTATPGRTPLRTRADTALRPAERSIEYAASGPAMSKTTIFAADHRRLLLRVRAGDWVLVVMSSTLGGCPALAQCGRSCPGRDGCHDRCRDGPVRCVREVR